MTAGAGTGQSSRKHRPGRIIERPRLIKLLDDAEAPLILIVAPAGYGKTTLARQWARTLNGVIWVSCTAAHRDVAVFAEDVAASIDAAGGNAVHFIVEYVRARSNPQQATRDIANALLKKLSEVPAQWLVIDDYQELADSPEIEELVKQLCRDTRARALIASRSRPNWITARHLLYGEVTQIGASELAMTASEARNVLGARPELERLARIADGWPAVVGLAAGLTRLPVDEPIGGALHRYVAEELYQGASPALQEQLIDLALLPALVEEHLRTQFGTEADSILAAARDLGFVGAFGGPELHPLVREFLLTKARSVYESDRLRAAVARALDAEAWSLAFDLVHRFELDDLVDTVLRRAFKPLVQSGRLETLSNFGRQMSSLTDFPIPAIEVIHAEVALRDGEIALATRIARRAFNGLPNHHELKSHAALLAGRASVLNVALSDATTSYRDAASAALDDNDRAEAAFGLAAAQIFGEVGDPSDALRELAELRDASPTYLVRYATAAANLRRAAGVPVDFFPDEATAALAMTPDPRVRTAFAYTAAYLMCVQAEYRRAETFLRGFARDVDEFDLHFARPFLDWTYAFAALGLRQFGDADRHLQRVEDSAATPANRRHAFNARILRARLLTQTGEAAAAVSILNLPAETGVYRSWQGELAATRALAYACLGDSDASADSASTATSGTTFIEVTALANAARAVTETNDGCVGAATHALFGHAAEFGGWDAVICALRGSPTFARAVAADSVLQPLVSRLLERAGDTRLGRQLSLNVRSRETPNVLLSPREFEVLGLMTRGMRNKEIAAALFVAESTVKVHVRHILEKLGVHSRSAAVARYERTADRPLEQPKSGA